MKNECVGVRGPALVQWTHQQPYNIARKFQKRVTSNSPDSDWCSVVRLSSCSSSHEKFEGYADISPQSESHDHQENNVVEAPNPLAFRFFRTDDVFRPVNFFSLLREALAKGASCVLASLRHFPRTITNGVKRLVKADFREQSEDNMWTQAHSFFVLMGGFMLHADGEPYCPLQPDHMLKLIREGCIDAPTLTETEIDDKSKGNVISKGLVVLQVTWFAMQFVTRIIYHLRITQLEVGTSTFAVFVFLTYAMWWNKPLDVRCPHPVYWKSTESRPEDHIDIPDADELELVQLGIWSLFLRPPMELMGFFMSVPTSRRLRVRTLDGSVDPEDSDKVVLVLVVMLLETMFAAMDCMAWSCPFPTYQEEGLWHISTVALICAPWLCTFSLFIANALETSLTSFIRFCALGSVYYVMARAMILVLMLTTLRDLPHDSDVFDTMQWTSLVPHL
ncbi:hypothetical protein BDR07DRAFT_1461979 [Suillus spraguei]|nr:hypothetical protein BDR07DRAFT_1461979 [Suillus spraguei]